MKTIKNASLSVLATICISMNVVHAESLVVAVTGENPPFEFVDGKGEVTGFEVDLLKTAANGLGKEIEFTVMPFNGLFSAVKSGRADVAVSTVTITPQRQQSIGFTQPYFDSNLCLVAPVKSSIHSTKDLQGKVLAVVTGTTPEMWATSNQAALGIAEIRRHDNLSEPVLALESERVDAFVQDCPMIQRYIKNKPNVEVKEVINTGEKFAAVTTLNSTLLPGLNGEISKLKQNGEMAKLYKQWFGGEAPEGSSVLMWVDSKN